MTASGRSVDSLLSRSERKRHRPATESVVEPSGSVGGAPIETPVGSERFRESPHTSDPASPPVLRVWLGFVVGAARVTPKNQIHKLVAIESRRESFPAAG